MKEFAMSNDEDNKSTFIVIADTRIKLSNIKQYGVSTKDTDKYELRKYEVKKNPNPEPKPKGFWKRLSYNEFIYEYEQDKRLYITTFQRDNFSFYKRDLRENFDRIVKQLDDYFT